MAKFHISKNGVPAPCKAQKGNCPFGGEDSHFNTREEAQSFADKKNAEEFGLINLKNLQEDVNVLKDKMSNVENVLPDLDSLDLSDKSGVRNSRLKKINPQVGIRDIHRHATMYDISREIRDNPTDSMYLDDKSYDDMQTKYWQIVDADFVENGYKAHNDPEYLKKLNIRAQIEALNAGVRTENAVNMSKLRPEELPQAFQRAPETEEEALEKANIERVILHNSKLEKDAQNDYNSVLNEMGKYKSFISKIRNRRKYRETREKFAYRDKRLQDTKIFLNAAVDKKIAFENRMNTDPISALRSRLENPSVNSNEMDYILDTLKHRHGFK